MVILISIGNWSNYTVAASYMKSLRSDRWKMDPHTVQLLVNSYGDRVTEYIGLEGTLGGLWYLSEQVV